MIEVPYFPDEDNGDGTPTRAPAAPVRSTANARPSKPSPRILNEAPTHPQTSPTPIAADPEDASVEMTQQEFENQRYDAFTARRPNPQQLKQRYDDVTDRKWELIAQNAVLEGTDRRRELIKEVVRVECWNRTADSKIRYMEKAAEKANG